VVGSARLTGTIAPAHRSSLTSLAFSPARALPPEIADSGGSCSEVRGCPQPVAHPPAVGRRDRMPLVTPRVPRRRPSDHHPLCSPRRASTESAPLAGRGPDRGLGSSASGMRTRRDGGARVAGHGPAGSGRPESRQPNLRPGERIASACVALRSPAAGATCSPGRARGFRRVEGGPAGAPAALRMRVAWVRRYLTMVNDRRVGFEDPGWP
jgi:hypothetical protein